MPGLRVRLREFVLSVPIPQSRARRAGGAQQYWNDVASDHWGSNSHVKGEVPGWEGIGLSHREMFECFARAAGIDPHPRRVLEWGAGGGANAVAFAPSAEEFLAVDVSRAVLEECRRQVAAVTDTPCRTIVVEVDAPEEMVGVVENPVDLFLCLYVIELLPSREHAARVMRVAARLLRPGGSALVQVKYRTTSPFTRSRTWSYSRQIAAMTSFAIHDFWELSASWGFTPRFLTLVPRNELDERYAYFFLTRD